MRIGILKIAAFGGCVALLASCAADSVDPTAEGERITHLRSQILDGSPDLGNPGRLELIGDNLVIITGHADSAIRVIRASDGALVRSFGRAGEGPGEYRAAWALEPDRTSPTGFWVLDLRLQRLTYNDLEALPPRPGQARLVRLAGAGPATSVVHMDDQSFLATGYFSEEGRLLKFDSDGEVLGILGPPPAGDSATHVTVRQHAYQSTIRRHPVQPLIAIGTRHADRLEIFRPDGELVAAAPRVRNFEPVYRMRVVGGNPVMDTGEDLRFGYIDVAATEHGIYALYSGRTRREAPGEANFGEIVHVFDWSGTPRHTFVLGEPVLAITVDSPGRRLYATRHAPEPAILAFELPDHQ
jgi:hypothetical protein